LEDKYNRKGGREEGKIGIIGMGKEKRKLKKRARWSEKFSSSF